MKIILASQSPRRRELLSLITEQFEIVPPEGEENCPEETPLYERPLMLARQKAEEVARKYPNDIVISADTAVFCDNKMFGKPQGYAEAREMLFSLSGKVHKVVTGCVIRKGEEEEAFSVTTDVEFYPLDEETVDWYIKTNECYDKAGAYGIQGKGALLVKSINGDYFNVVGLPVAELHFRLKKSI